MKPNLQVGLNGADIDTNYLSGDSEALARGVDSRLANFASGELEVRRRLGLVAVGISILLLLRAWLLLVLGYRQWQKSFFNREAKKVVKT